MRLTPKKWTLIALKSYIEYVHFFKANLITLFGISFFFFFGGREKEQQN